VNDEARQRLARDGSVELTVRVRPQASATRLKERMANGVWKIDVAAVPEDGAANEVLRRFIAAGFGVPIQNVEIVSGQTSREKKLRVSGRIP